MSYRDGLFDLSYNQSKHFFISIPVLSGLIAFGFNNGIAYIVFWCSLIVWAVFIGAVISGVSLQLIVKPYFYLGLATILLVVVFKTYVAIGVIIMLSLGAVYVVVSKIISKSKEQQLKANIKRNKELGPVVANRNDYTALKLDSVSVAPLDETDIHAFRNTPAYKKMQAANKINPIRQYASY